MLAALTPTWSATSATDRFRRMRALRRCWAKLGLRANSLVPIRCAAANVGSASETTSPLGLKMTSMLVYADPILRIIFNGCASTGDGNGRDQWHGSRHSDGQPVRQGPRLLWKGVAAF